MTVRPLLTGALPDHILLPGAVGDLRAEGAHTRLLGEERAAVVHSVERRRREFGLGRTCARAALLRLGIAPAPIPVGPDRAPVWPSGIVGSITHCNGLGAAVVARRADWQGIGLDVERVVPMPLGVRKEICTGREEEWIGVGPEAGVRAILLFSAKESIYKAIAPIGRQWVGFTDVEVVFNADSSSFGAVYLGDLPLDLPDPDRLLGRFAVVGPYALTAAFLPTDA